MASKPASLSTFSPAAEPAQRHHGRLVRDFLLGRQAEREEGPIRRGRLEVAPDGDADPCPSAPGPGRLRRRPSGWCPDAGGSWLRRQRCVAPGELFMSPTRRSAAGLRSWATASRRGEASIPAPVAPRAAAEARGASPDPQAMSQQPIAGPDAQSLVHGHVLAAVGALEEAAKSTALRPQPSSTVRQSWSSGLGLRGQPPWSSAGPPGETESLPSGRRRKPARRQLPQLGRGHRKHGAIPPPALARRKQHDDDQHLR